MLIFKKVNSKVSSINNYLQKYLESNQFEKNLKEALNNKNYGVSNSLLYDLSISTYDANYYKRVMSEVFKAIQEKPSKWRRIYKGLRLCEYVMKNGCEYFISDVKDNEELIKKLTHFTHLEDLKDKGVGIREISNNILTLLRDNKYLKNERIEAAKYANICTNIESKPIEKKGFFSSRKKNIKNKEKNYFQNNKRHYIDAKNTKNTQEKSIFDQIEEERNMLNKYANNNYDTNDIMNRSDVRRRGSEHNSVNPSSSGTYTSDESSDSSSNSSAGSGSGYIDNHKLNKSKSTRDTKHRNLSAQSSKYSNSSSPSNSDSRYSSRSRPKSGSRSSSRVTSRTSSHDSSTSSSSSRSSSRRSRYSSASSDSSYSSRKKSHAQGRNRKSKAHRSYKTGRSR